MLSSVRRVFRSKSKPDKTPTVKEKPVPQPSPVPIAQTRTTFFYSGIQTFHSTESDNIEWVGKIFPFSCCLTKRPASFSSMDWKETVKKRGRTRLRGVLGRRHSFLWRSRLHVFSLTLMIQLLPARTMVLHRIESRIMHIISWLLSHHFDRTITQ